MKKLFFISVCLLFSSFVFGQNFFYSGSTSIYGTFFHESDNFESDEKTGNIDLLALEELSVAVSPVDNLTSFIDLSMLGSVTRYDINDKSFSPNFNIDINQIYINYSLNYFNFVLGKKVFNFGVADSFPLVNLVNPRRNDKFRMVAEGTGSIGITISPFSWGSFNLISYLNSNDLLNDYDDIQFSLISDFYVWNSYFSTYLYLANIFDFDNDPDVYKDNISIPFGFSFSTQISFFNLYTELIFIEKKWNETFGLRYANSHVNFEIEYCVNNNALKEKDKDKNNFSLALSYSPISELTIALSDVLSINKFNSEENNFGNTVSLTLNSIVNQLLDLTLSGSYSFGSKDSNLLISSEKDLTIFFGAKVIY